MHTVADRWIPLPGLPSATTCQKHDALRCVEKLAGMPILPRELQHSGHPVWPDPVVAALQRKYGGDLPGRIRFHAHLDGFRDALTLGAILLMIDTNEALVAEVGNRARHRHPEAPAGGGGWGTEVFCRWCRQYTRR